MLRHECEKVEVGGSIRRGEAMVKDAELIAIPNHPYYHIKTGKLTGTTLWNATDDLVERGVVTKALYGDKQSPRWGEKYRGMLYRGIKVEVFLADQQNWGYQKWLRTGPGESNHYIMGYLIRQRSPIRFVDGYAWYSPGNLWRQMKKGSKDVWVANDQQMLRVLDEEGCPTCPPTSAPSIATRVFWTGIAPTAGRTSSLMCMYHLHRAAKRWSVRRWW
jgi:hypothetical protein